MQDLDIGRVQVLKRTDVKVSSQVIASLPATEYVGIIQNIKQIYRKRMMGSLLMKMDECTVASELAKKINILDAIMWLHYAWESILPITIYRCFAKCGFSEDVYDPEKPFADCPELEEIIDGVTLEEFAAMGDNMETCQQHGEN